MANLPEGAQIVNAPLQLPEGAEIVSEGETEKLGVFDALNLATSVLFAPQKAAEEAVIGVGTGVAGLVGGGLAGAGTLATGGGVSQATENIRKVQDFLTIQPSTPEGQKALETVGQALETAVRHIEGGLAGTAELVAGRGIPQAAETTEQVIERGPGDVVFERTGSPVLATAADLFVDTALIATTPVKGLKPTTVAAKSKAKIKSTPEQKKIIQQLERDEITPNEALASLEEIGEGATIADVGGANVRELAAVTGAVTRKGREARSSALLGRDTKLMKDAAKEADVFYDAAYAERVIRTKSLIAQLNSPAVLESGIIKDAIKLIRFKSTKKLSKEQRAEALSMFDGKGGIRFENLNVIGLDHLKRALRQRAGGLKIKKGELAGTFKDAGEALGAELVAQNKPYSQAMDAWKRFKDKQELFAETAAATEISSTRQIQLQKAFDSGFSLEKISSMSTDALFAINQNRFAVLRLIQDTANLFKKKGKAKEIAEGQAEILYNIDDARVQLKEIADIVGQESSPVSNALRLSDSKLVNWLRSEQNLRIVGELGAKAIIIERQNQGQQ